MTKPCVKCGKNCPLTEYYRNSTYKDGYDSTCKTCRKNYRKQYYQANRERVNGSSKEWARSHPQQRRKYRARWAEKNPDYHKNYYHAHIESFRGNGRKTYRKNRAVVITRTTEWRLKNPERWRERHRYQQARRRAREHNAGGSHSRIEWEELCKIYDYRCLACGKIRVLTEDHVIPISRGGTDNIDNIQPLCRSCNAKKGTRIIDFRQGITCVAVSLGEITMVGGKIQSIYRIDDRTCFVIRGTGCEANDERCLEIKRAPCEPYGTGDSVWWQGEFVYWTPRDKAVEDFPIPLLGHAYAAETLYAEIHKLCCRGICPTCGFDQCMADGEGALWCPKCDGSYIFRSEKENIA